jgi:hypothetical protein
MTRNWSENLAWKNMQQIRRRSKIMKKKIYKSEAFSAIHASASALHKVGAIDKATMRDFDVASLSAVFVTL